MNEPQKNGLPEDRQGRQSAGWTAAAKKVRADWKGKPGQDLEAKAVPDASGNTEISREWREFYDKIREAVNAMEN